MKKITILLFIILGLNYLSQAQSSFYNIDSIQKVEITINQPNWDYQMDTAVYGAGGSL
jgi:hypothetical protein